MAKNDGSFTPATVALIRARDRDGCALCGFTVAGERGRGWSVHHRKPRGMGGTKDPAISSPANGVLLHGTGTTMCHGKVEANREGYTDAGFLINRNSRSQPSDVAILHAIHGLVYLDDLGGWVRHDDAA